MTVNAVGQLCWNQFCREMSCSPVMQEVEHEAAVCSCSKEGQ